MVPECGQTAKYNDINFGYNYAETQKPNPTPNPAQHAQHSQNPRPTQRSAPSTATSRAQHSTASPPAGKPVLGKKTKKWSRKSERIILCHFVLWLLSYSCCSFCCFLRTHRDSKLVLDLGGLAGCLAAEPHNIRVLENPPDLSLAFISNISIWFWEMTCMMHTNSTSKVWIQITHCHCFHCFVISSLDIAPRCPGVIFNHFTVEDGQSTLQDLHAIMKSELFDCLRSNDQPPSSRCPIFATPSRCKFQKINSAGSSIYPIVRIWPPFDSQTNKHIFFFTESAVLN